MTNASTRTLHCCTCDILSVVSFASLLSPAEILFVEFASDARNNLTFYEDVEIIGLHYKLKGLVCCSSHHFTCACKNDQYGQSYYLMIFVIQCLHFTICINYIWHIQIIGFLEFTLIIPVILLTTQLTMKEQKLKMFT